MAAVPALVLVFLMGMLACINPVSALGLFAGVFPFDYPAMEKSPITIFSDEALLTGLFAGITIYLYGKRLVLGKYFMGAMSCLGLVVLASIFSLWGADVKCAVPKQILRDIQFWLLLACTAKFTADKKRFSYLIGGLLLGGAVVGILMLAEAGAAFPWSIRSDGPFGRNTIPSFTGMVFMVWLASVAMGNFKPVSRWKYWALGLIALACAMGQNRIGLFTVPMGLLVWALLAGRKNAHLAKFPFILFCSCTLLVVAHSREYRFRLESVAAPLETPEMVVRMKIYRVGREMIRTHPIIGIGAGNYSSEVAQMRLTSPLVRGMTPREYGAVRSHLHNFFLQEFAETGLFGLAAWLAGLGWIGLAFWRIRLRTPAVSASGLGLLTVFLSTNMLDDTMIHSRGAMFALGWGMLLGLAGGKWRKQ